MKRNKEKMRKRYVSPSVEILEVDVEQGFAASGAVIKGNSHDFTTIGFGDGDGGSTMGDF